MMRHVIPDIRQRLARVRESREPLAATQVEALGEVFLVVTLAPPWGWHLRREQRSWETRVHGAAPRTGGGLGSHPRYVVLDGNRRDALDRHERLVRRLEAGTFEAETAREVMSGLRPILDRATEAFRRTDVAEALRLIEDAVRVASRLDAAQAFLHAYVEAYLLRSSLLEHLDPREAIRAYRDFIALYSRLPAPDSRVLQAVAEAREAVERLTPVPPRTAPAAPRAAGT